MLINNRAVGNGITHFPYIAYLQALLNYSELSKKSVLEPALYYKDRENYMDTMDPAGTTNSGFVHRAAKAQKSRVMDLACPLMVPWLSGSRPFPTNTEIFLRFHRASERFCAMWKDADANPIKINIKTAALRITRLHLYPGAQKALESGLKVAPAIYPFHEWDVRPIFIAKDTQNLNREIYEGMINEYKKVQFLKNYSCILGVLPPMLLLMLVPETAYNSAADKNPFNFKHYEISDLSLEINGRMFPKLPYKPVWSGEETFTEMYLAFLQNLNISFENPHILITREMYQNGYTIFAFNLAKDGMFGGDHGSLQDAGSIRVKMQFKSKLTESVVLLACGIFERNLMLDEDRNPTIA